MLARLFNIRSIVAETAAFDTHRLLKPNVSASGYAKGPLYRIDLRAYLALKFDGKCAYCHKTLRKGWQADHIIPKSRGGSDRPYNRAAACKGCNERKDNQTAAEFGHPEVGEQGARRLSTAGIMTSLRTTLVRALADIAPVAETDGALTAINRGSVGLEKSHAVDALCALQVPMQPVVPRSWLWIVARSCGTRRLAGGIRGERKMRLPRQVNGFRQWDLVKWNGKRCYIKARGMKAFWLSDLFGKSIKQNVPVRRLKLLRRRSTLQGELLSWGGKE